MRKWTNRIDKNGVEQQQNHRLASMVSKVTVGKDADPEVVKIVLEGVKDSCCIVKVTG